MKRTVIKIDEEKCNGCEECVNGCHEGALQMIEGKARLVSELYCDGLGACIGTCPEGAIILEEREAEPYSETAVMDRISKLGEKTITAHLKHLKDHNEMGFFEEGINYLKEKEIDIDINKIINNILNGNNNSHKPSACPGSKQQVFNINQEGTAQNSSVQETSELTHWPIQLHLINPQAAHFNKCDLLIAADCVPFAMPGFHSEFLKNKKLIIACPKLDSNKESYVEKIKSLIEDAKVNTITVAIMQVPCCSGLLQLTQLAADSSNRKVPVKYSVIGIQGEILEEEWL